jgi:hypothetical protein
MNIKQSPILLLVALKNELEAIAIPKSIPVAYTGVGKINGLLLKLQSCIISRNSSLILAL